MSTLDVSTALTCTKSKTVVFGITLTFPQAFKTGNEAKRFFQASYIDELGADGLFQLVARDRSDLFTLNYWQGDEEAQPKLAGTHSLYVSPDKLDACLRVVDGYSYLDILLGNTHAGAFKSEADFITKELNTYLDEGFVVNWTQFSLVPGGR